MDYEFARQTRNKKAIDDYARIINNYVSDMNKKRLGINLMHWAKKNNRDPRMIYHYQNKILKGSKRL